MFIFKLLVFHLVSASAFCQLLLGRLLLRNAANDSVFVPWPTLFGECTTGMCANEASPTFGVGNSRVVLEQLTPCSFKSQDFCPYLGTIELDRKTYCDPRTLRGVPATTCCFPRLPGDNFPRMSLFPVNSSAINPNAIRLDWRSADDSLKIPPADKIIILVHGWTENPLDDGSLWLYPTLEAWTKTRGYPVIVVDYDTGDYQYFQNAANARTVGAAVGYAIVNWGIAAKTHLVGFSLGGQIVGEIGKYTQKQGQLVKECIALDPAGIAFDWGLDKIHVTPTDCETVQVIHSSSESLPDSLGMISSQLGTFFHSGSCDFWINCGRRQAADCRNPILGATMNISSDLYHNSVEPDACSHFRAPLIYAASVAGKCDFIGYECTNCNDFRLTSGCRVNFKGKQVRLPPFNECKSSDRLDFFVSAKSNNYPYC